MAVSLNNQEERLEELKEKEAEDLTKILSSKYNVPYLNLLVMPISPDALETLPQKTSLEGQMAVFQKTGKILKIALRNPNLETTKNILKGLESQGFKLNLFLVSEKSLKKAIDFYQNIPKTTRAAAGMIDVSAEKIKYFSKIINNLESVKQELSKISASRQKVSEVLEILIAGALATESSDVHIEPQEKEVDIRFRLDGVLQNITSIPHSLFQLLLSRIKLISGLKLNIHDEAQSGRFSIRSQTTKIEVRTSSLPGPYGESIVLRLLYPKTIGMELEDLGMQPDILETALGEIKKPNGMILTTGPTGSGKTTTLYAFLKKIRSPQIKIITIEDPIEYRLSGITQTQIGVQPQKYNFENGLKSILRQDPDVIMVGEIRDKETAETAIHAALTGHLVFSTLHTKNAAGTILRLVDLGVKPNLIAPAINLAIAQRLVRRLCQKSKIKDKPTKKELEIIKKIIETFPKTKKPDIRALNVWRANPCSSCSNTGYKGRIGLFEAILIDEEIERLILKNPIESDIQKAASRQNILNLRQDSILKILKGITSFEEAARVVEL